MYTVAIITRTKDRPLMLERAMTSITNQDFEDYCWVIVNDCGDTACVEKAAANARDLGVFVVVINLKQSKGIEYASNQGIGCVDSKYIIIHDDDDTWSRDFLSATVNFLESNNHYVGVATQSNKIVEEVLDDKIKIKKTMPLNAWLKNVTLSAMSTRNQFPPISFLFRRSLYESIGGFNESLPVLGDWDFNLKSLLVGDIGIIPERLANYHHRYDVKRGKEQYGNTVTLGLSQHIEWEAIYRNMKLREDIQNNTVGIGFLLAQGEHINKIMLDYEGLGIFSKAIYLLYSFIDTVLPRKIFNKLHRPPKP